MISAATLGCAAVERECRPLLSVFSRPRNFEKAVQPELAVLYRVARRMGCSQDQSEDLVQTTLLKAYQAWEKFDGRHLRSWLIRILRNEHLMVLRSGRHEVSLDEPDAPEVQQAPFWCALSDKIEADEIIAALTELPDIYRMAVQLCDVEQMSYEEAAQALECPIGTVRSRLFRARALLRTRLAHLQETP